MQLDSFSTHVAHRQQRDRRFRRYVMFGLAGCLLVAMITYAWVMGPSYLAYWNYEPREGDILFQSLPHSRLVDAIEGVSESPLSHCGIVSQ